MEASGATRKAAERNLKEKLARRGSYSAGFGELSPDTVFTKLVEVWLEDLDLEDRIAVSTRDLYERDMRTLVMPAFEHYTLREISISKVDRFLKSQAKVSYSRAKHAKVVLKLALGLALRYEAISRNPVLGTSRLRRPPSQAMALTVTPKSRPSGTRSGFGDVGEGYPVQGQTDSSKRSSRSCLEPLPASVRYWRSASAMSMSPAPRRRSESAALSSRRKAYPLSAKTDRRHPSRGAPSLYRRSQPRC